MSQGKNVWLIQMRGDPGAGFGDMLMQTLGKLSKWYYHLLNVFRSLKTALHNCIWNIKGKRPEILCLFARLCLICSSLMILFSRLSTVFDKTLQQHPANVAFWNATLKTKVKFKETSLWLPSNVTVCWMVVQLMMLSHLFVLCQVGCPIYFNNYHIYWAACMFTSLFKKEAAAAFLGWESSCKTALGVGLEGVLVTAWVLCNWHCALLMSPVNIAFSWFSTLQSSVWEISMCIFKVYFGK